MSATSLTSWYRVHFTWNGHDFSVPYRAASKDIASQEVAIRMANRGMEQIEVTETEEL